MTESAFGLNDRLKVDALYEKFIQEQQHEFDEIRREGGLELPADLDYAHPTMQFLSNEEREKLALTPPVSVGAASRIPGLTPSALISLLRFVKKQQTQPPSGTASTTAVRKAMLS